MFDYYELLSDNYSKSCTKTRLTKKQKAVRVKNKIARKSKKINRKK